jgi:hypothetical protein
MTAVQLNAMNTQLLQGIGVIADDESLMKRLTKFVAKLVREKTQDPTLMTKEEFFARIDKAEQEIAEGKGITFTNREDMNAWLNSL